LPAPFTTWGLLARAKKLTKEGLDQKRGKKEGKKEKNQGSQHLGYRWVQEARKKVTLQVSVFTLT